MYAQNEASLVPAHPDPALAVMLSILSCYRVISVSIPYFTAIFRRVQAAEEIYYSILCKTMFHTAYFHGACAINPVDIKTFAATVANVPYKQNVGVSW